MTCVMPSSTVSHEWMTFARAAVVLGVSTRTIERRVKAGQLQARADADGRREVLVQVVSDVASDAVASCPSADDRQVSDVPVVSDNAAVDVRQLVLAVQQVQQVVLADLQAERRRRRAWSVAAGVVLVASVAVVSSMLTRLADVSDQLVAADAERDRLVQQVGQLQNDLARAQVQQNHAASVRPPLLPSWWSMTAVSSSE